jgi:predicted nucleotidyltransferase component of viral defense system
MRLKFDADDKQKIASLVKAWAPGQVTLGVFDTIRSDFGVPKGLVQTMFWHVDTLDAVSGLDWLVFKGGTCVQSYIPWGLQRASDDLDFNSVIENPNAIRDEIEKWNIAAIKKGNAVSVRGIDFGLLEFVLQDKSSGTLTFRRRMPTKFGDLELIKDKDVQAKTLKVQINYKHAWLPAIKKVTRPVDFFIMKYQSPKHKVQVVHSSAEDLIADKMVAISRANPSHREKFKDVYDIWALLQEQRDGKLVMEKLEAVADARGLKAQALKEGVVQTISDLGEKGHMARDHGALVCKDGRKELEDWEGFCQRTVKAIQGLVNHS